MMPEKIDLAGTAPRDERIAQLRQLYPEVFTDGKIDFDALRLALGDEIDTAPREERFGLRWPGKSKLQQVINTPSVGTLIPQPEESVDWDTTQNLIIEGDNLEVLKLLQKSYAGKIKMIYIDPPYNTGNEFVYPDHFSEGLKSYLEFTEQVDGAGRKVEANTESSGRYHANWLNMMHPRLYLARNLLSEDGVIFVSIDDHELTNLVAMMNEIFGEENFFAVLVRRAMHTVRNSAKDFNLNADYVVAFALDKSWFAASPDRYIRKQVDKSSNYTKNDNDGRGPYKLDPLTARNYNKPYAFEFQNGVKWEAKGGRFPAYSPTTLAQMERDGKIDFGGREPMAKRYLAEVQQGQPPDQILDPEDVGFNMHGTSEVSDLFAVDAVFSQPKPVRLGQYLAELARVSDQDIVLDFFAGSGTTGHAVMNLNVTENMGESTRRFILVQLPEPLDEPTTLDDGTQLHTIADICRERVRRAGKKIRADHADAIAKRTKPLDTGFRAYKLAPSNFTPWNGAIEPGNIARQLELAADHTLPDATDEGMLAELLLKIGLDLTTPVTTETIAGKKVFNIESGSAFACFDRQITLKLIEELAARLPAEIICLDAGFPDDQTKVNAGQIIASAARAAEASIAFKVI